MVAHCPNKHLVELLAIDFQVRVTALCTEHIIYCTVGLLTVPGYSRYSLYLLQVTCSAVGWVTVRVFSGSIHPISLTQQSTKCVLKYQMD